MSKEKCEACFASGYCYDKGTENECEDEPVSNEFITGAEKRRAEKFVGKEIIKIDNLILSGDFSQHDVSCVMLSQQSKDGIFVLDVIYTASKILKILFTQLQTAKAENEILKNELISQGCVYLQGIGYLKGGE